MAMNSSLVRYQVRAPIAEIVLDRADKRNALSRGLIDGLADAFAQARDEARVRVVLLSGSGPVFCAGMDLAELQESLVAANETSPVWEDALRLARLYDLIYSLPKPTIALVQGPAVAGGAGLVTVCDLALATPDARFGYPEVRRGLVAAMVMPHLLRHVGERLARYLLLSGELIDADAALRGGLVNEVVPAEQIRGRAEVVARALAEGGPQALSTTKTFLRQFSRQALSIEQAAEGSAAPRLGQECQDGLRAFFEKKPAPWSPR
jgi:methylglutaconyl-CoA hydratase